MKNIIEDILDRVFNVVTMTGIMFVLFIYVIIMVGLNEEKAHVEQRLQVAACYDIGMVRIMSDAGPRCVLPANLSAIK